LGVSLGYRKNYTQDMSKIKLLNEQRVDVIRKMESLLETATANRRELNKAESREWDQLDKQAKDMKQEIEDLEKSAKAAASTSFSKSNSGTADERWVDTRTGRDVQVLGRNDSLLDTLQPDERGLCLARYIKATVTGDWRDAESEARFLSTAPGSAGVTVPFSLMAQVLQMAREKSIMSRLGISTVPMDSNNLTIAKVTSEPTMQYKAEGAPFNTSDVTFGSAVLNAHTLGTVVTMSRELIADSPNALQAIRTAMANSIAAELDRMIIFGSGVNQPLGLINQPIQEVEVNSNLVDYSSFIESWVKLKEVNCEPNAYLLSPRDAGQLEGLVSGAAGIYMAPPQAISQLQRHISSKIPTNLGAGTNESVCLMGDFSQLLLGLRQNFLMELSTSGSDFSNHTVSAKLTWRGSTTLLQDNHFVKLTGITA
jgi:HK97 family phage major capsid protein